MEIQVWVGVATLIVALSGFYAGLRRELKSEVGGLRTELKGDIAASRAELKGDIGRLEDRIERLDDRVYALAVGLKPELEARGEGG